MEIGHEEVYYWVATLDNNKVITSIDSAFASLPFQSVRYFELRPIDKGYAPIRVCTNGKPFKYFRKVRGIMGSPEITVYYVIQTDEKAYIVKFPDKQYFTVKLEEIESL